MKIIAYQRGFYYFAFMSANRRNFLHVSAKEIFFSLVIFNKHWSISGKQYPLPADRVLGRELKVTCAGTQVCRVMIYYWSLCLPCAKTTAPSQAVVSANKDVTVFLFDFISSETGSGRLGKAGLELNA